MTIYFQQIKIILEILQTHPYELVWVVTRLSRIIDGWKETRWMIGSCSGIVEFDEGGVIQLAILDIKHRKIDIQCERLRDGGIEREIDR